MRRGWDRTRHGELRRVNAHMTARRRRQWWQRNRRQIAQELRALLPRVDWRKS